MPGYPWESRRLPTSVWCLTVRGTAEISNKPFFHGPFSRLFLRQNTSKLRKQRHSENMLQIHKRSVNADNTTIYRSTLQIHKTTTEAFPENMLVVCTQFATHEVLTFRHTVSTRVARRPHDPTRMHPEEFPWASHHFAKKKKNVRKRWKMSPFL